jgi:hypothetical protein
MSEISKSQLKADNATSFPDNNSGYITPLALRNFNINIIDSTVNQAGYTTDSGSWNVSIGQLNTYTASFAPSLTQLNAFTASQLVVNSNLNAFTQSAGASINRLDTFSSSFNAYTASINQIRSNGVTLGTSTIFNLVGPGTFFSASLVQNIQGNIATLTFTSDNGKVNTSSFNDYTASTAATQSVFSASVATSFSSSNATFTQFSASQNNFNLSATASLVELLNLSSSLSGGYATQGELDYSASILQGNIDSLAVSQAISNSYFATTGSNTFRGIETFEDVAGNATSLVSTSGSLMLVAKGYNSSSLHLTSSAAGKVNIIFKNTNAAATTYISGSNNIFSDTQAPTAGFKRQLGEANINLFLALPQVSASMGDYVAIDNNFITARNTSPMTMRGPISSSEWQIKGNVVTQQLNIGTSATNHAQGLVSGLFVNNCYIGANLSIIANRTNTTQQANITNSNLAGAVSLVMASSSIDYGNNITAGGTVTINNNSTGSARVTALNNAAWVNSNILGGNTTITFSGSNDPNDAQDIDYNGGVVRSLIHGSGINARVNTGLTGSNTLAGTAIIGNSLTVSGSSQNPITNGGTNLGSAFFGRYNALDGNRAKSAETVFAIGTGNSTTRKTGFLIDSGSNTFVEGTLNVSGSLSFTGSVYGNVSASVIASSTASIDLSVANYFTLTLSGSTNINVTNPQPGVTATLVINTSTNASASFSNNVKQPSGSFYAASPSGNIDIISFTAVDSNTVYAFPAQSFV